MCATFRIVNETLKDMQCWFLDRIDAISLSNKMIRKIDKSGGQLIKLKTNNINQWSPNRKSPSVFKICLNNLCPQQCVVEKNPA